MLPAAVRKILSMLRQRGHSAFVVGGCVRDCLSGRVPNDWDICTSARPGEIKAVFAGCSLEAAGSRHGTVAVTVDHMVCEVTTFRVESGYSDHRHPDQVRFVRSIFRDLERRDFTINAMAYSPEYGLVDPFGGAQDLADRRLRCVGEPARRFSEDALRILRMLRFCAALGVQAEPKTAAAAAVQCRFLQKVSVERMRPEFCRMLCGKYAGDVLCRYRTELEALFAGLVSVPDEAWKCTAQAVEHAPQELAVRMALLCGVLDAQEVTAFCPDGEIARTVRQASQYADVPLQALPGAVRGLLNRIGPQVLDIVAKMRLAVAQAQNDAVLAEQTQAFMRSMEKVLREGGCYSRSMLAVNGNDAIEAGIPAGAAVGQALEQLLCEVIRGTLPNDRSELLKQLRLRAKPTAGRFEQAALF